MLYINKLSGKVLPDKTQLPFFFASGYNARMYEMYISCYMKCTSHTTRDVHLVHLHTMD